MSDTMVSIIGITHWDVQNLLKLAYITLPIMIAIAILGITILWNQRKIKKMLRELQEQNKEEKDKP